MHMSKHDTSDRIHMSKALQAQASHVIKLRLTRTTWLITELKRNTPVKRRLSPASHLTCGEASSATSCTAADTSASAEASRPASCSEQRAAAPRSTAGVPGCLYWRRHRSRLHPAPVRRQPLMCAVVRHDNNCASRYCAAFPVTQLASAPTCPAKLAYPAGQRVLK